ncbi:MAG TPA: sigma-70 family RNA polymerase sigma factor [Planctomycetota bacterium]|nr:sigma-70 family RNA polymerase sigma factor [Planctomycetota bacterium]
MSEGSGLAARTEGRSVARAAELQSLLVAVSKADQAALAQLYDLTSRPVFALALRILKDRQIAEEVVLDVFLQIWNRAASFDPSRGRPFGWILTIARSRALDALRSRTVRSRREEDLALGAAVSDLGATPPERAAATDRSRRVADAIAALPADQASAVELAYFQDLSHAEIAERLALPLGTIKTRIRLGMLKLRERLKTFEDER